jgi:hypothetical protein
MRSAEQASCDVVHHFAPSIYIRECHFKKGTLVVGREHKSQHLNFLVKGKVRLIDGDKKEQVLEAPLMLVAEAGRKVAFIEEDTVWQNIYATNEKDLSVLDKELYVEDKDYIEYKESIRDNLLVFKEDEEDFYRFLEEEGLTLEQVCASSFDESLVTELPYGSYKIEVSDSSIHGKGLFATACIKAGEKIAQATISGKKTIAGRYINHSAVPNATAVRNGNEIDVVALYDIYGSHGGLLGEEITMDYRIPYSFAKEIAKCHQ